MVATIPLLSKPQQIVTCSLGGQRCTIMLRTMTNGQGIGVTALYCDLYVNDSLIIGGVICQNANRIVRSAYLEFIGDLAFWDTSGAGDDPTADGLGARFQLVYWSPSDLAAVGIIE